MAQVASIFTTTESTKMNPIRKRRLYFIGLLIVGLGVATTLILYALQKNINVFVTPTQAIADHLPADYHFRLGGMVKQGSVVREKEGLAVTFIVTDLKQEMTVHYKGVLPDLFREGKGVIVEGHLDGQNGFSASQVLAKHDENYMPRNIDQTLRKNGG